MPRPLLPPNAKKEQAPPITSVSLLSALVSQEEARCDRCDDMEMRLRALEARVGKLEEKNRSLKAQVAWLSRQLFGVKRERIAENTLQLIFSLVKDDGAPQPLIDAIASGESPLESEQASPIETPAPLPPMPPPPATTPKKGRHKHGRSALPAHFEIETVTMPMTMPEGARFVHYETSSRLAYRPACFVHLIVQRPKIAIDKEDGKTAFRIAPTPEEMIERGLPDPAMLAHVLASKWLEHQPFLRMEKRFARQGLSLAASTLSQWEKRAAFRLEDFMTEFFEQGKREADAIAMDATTVRVCADGHDRRAYLWAFILGKEQVVFQFSAMHTGDMPRDWLSGYRGPLLVDASSVYHEAFAEHELIEYGCHAHCRRKFVYALESDARAMTFIELENRLFDVERYAIAMSPEERETLRMQYSLPILERFADERERALKDKSIDAKGPLRKALKYSENHWGALCRFIHNGFIPIHNNDCEREIRHVAIGRKNWEHLGSDSAAEAGCVWLSLVGSAKMAGLDPEGYLRDLFRVFPEWPCDRWRELWPKNWAKTRARLNPKELVARLGPITMPPELAE